MISHMADVTYNMIPQIFLTSHSHMSESDRDLDMTRKKVNIHHFVDVFWGEIYQLPGFHPIPGTKL